MHQVIEHLTHMIALALTIARRVINPIIDQPELIQCRIDIDTGDHANPLDHRFGIAAVLPSHPFNGKGSVFIQYRIIENHIALSRGDDLTSHILPNQSRGNILTRR